MVDRLVFGWPLKLPVIVLCLCRPITLHIGRNFYDKVCFAGHVVNILLNYRGPLLLVKLIVKVSKLSGKSPEETYELLKSIVNVYKTCWRNKIYLPRFVRNTILCNRINLRGSWLGTNIWLMLKRSLENLNWISCHFSDRKHLMKIVMNHWIPVSTSSITKNSSNFDETSSLLSLTVVTTQFTLNLTTILKNQE